VALKSKNGDYGTRAFNQLAQVGCWEVVRFGMVYCSILFMKSPQAESAWLPQAVEKPAYRYELSLSAVDS
jgi:hypothetical protein